MSKFRRLGSAVIALSIICSGMPAIQAKATENSDLSLGKLTYVSSCYEKEFKFNVTDADYYVIETDQGSSLRTNDTIMYIYDKNHNLIGKNDDVNIKDENVKNKMSLFARYLEKGDYYVKVVSKDGSKLYCDIRADKLTNLDNLKLNSNDKITSAEGRLYKSYSFKLDKPTDIIMETSSLNDRRINTEIVIYDEMNNIIAENDDIDSSKYNLYSKIEKNLPAGKYYAKVKMYRPSNQLLSANISLSDNSKPYAYITSPKDKGYIFQQENRTFEINASKDATKLDLDYVINGKTIDISDKLFWNDEKNCYEVNAEIKETMHHSVDGVNGEYKFPKFRVNLTTSKGDAIGEVQGVITSNPRWRYFGIDQSFYYNDEVDNSFVGLPTSDYNCMAYALGVTDQWLWPWSVGFPQYDVVTFYFEKLYGYKDRPGKKFTEFSPTLMQDTQLFFYSGHVAKVTKWDKDGKPVEILSKWGASELIKSTAENSLRAWGDPIIYIKGEVE